MACFDIGYMNWPGNGAWLKTKGLAFQKGLTSWLCVKLFLREPDLAKVVVTLPEQCFFFIIPTIVIV